MWIFNSSLRVTRPGARGTAEDENGNSEQQCNAADCSRSLRVIRECFSRYGLKLVKVGDSETCGARFGLLGVRIFCRDALDRGGVGVFVISYLQQEIADETFGGVIGKTQRSTRRTWHGGNPAECAGPMELHGL